MAKEDELVKATNALLLVQLQALMVEAERDKPELVLSRAGYTAKEIAGLVGKKEAAIAKTIQRAGKAA